MNVLFVLITAFIAWHGLTYRDKQGNKDIVKLLFGAISLLFCLRVLFTSYKLTTFQNQVAYYLYLYFVVSYLYFLTYYFLF